MAAPVRHTCPDIDKVIKSISTALKIASKARLNADKGDDYDNYNDIENELWNLERDLEDLRSDNSVLREWGLECEAKIEQMDEEKYLLEQEIEELKSVTA